MSGGWFWAAWAISGAVYETWALSAKHRAGHTLSAQIQNRVLDTPVIKRASLASWVAFSIWFTFHIWFD